MRRKKIKIALVAPPFGDTGGPEVVVGNLAASLLERGLDVTLFAPADWQTKAKHVHTLPQSLWNMKDFKSQIEQVRRNLIIESQLKVLNYQKKFDIIHLNSQRYAYAVARLAEKPCVLTFHNKITLPEFNQIQKAGISTVALSERHKKKLNVSAVIPNGIATQQIKYSFRKGSYLMVIGRLTEQKGVDIAIKIAKRANKKLLIFGRVGNSAERQKYFRKKIKPFLDKDKIVYMGEASQGRLFSYLKKAEALLYPIQKTLSVCPLVVMEALACGTPVIGAEIVPAPEPLKDSSVAFLSNNLSSLVKAAKFSDKFDRHKCRKYAETYFDRSIMAEKYINLYKKILKKVGGRSEE